MSLGDAPSTAHTPQEDRYRTPQAARPWSVWDRGIGFEVVDPNGDGINGGFRETFNEADAHLIAAAPDLLSALKAMVLNDRHTYRDCHKAALAAIAKATGAAQ